MRLVWSRSPSGAFTADPARKLNILWHDGNSLGVDGAQVCVFEKTHEVSLAGFLESHHCRALETEVRLEILSDLAHQPLERKLANQQFGGFLVATDLTESHRAWPVSVGFLDASGCRRTLASCLGGQLFARRFATSGLSCGLLGASHFTQPLFLKHGYSESECKRVLGPSCGESRFIR